MFGGEVVQRKQRFAILCQAFDRDGMLRPIFLGEDGDRRFGGSPVRRQVNLAQIVLHVRLHRHRDLVQHVGSLVHPTSLMLRGGEDLVERLPEAEPGAIVSPRLFASTSSSRQLCALSRTPTRKPMSSFLPSGVAPISTSMHSLWSSIRACRKTPSAHTYTYRRADRSRFCQRSYSPCHSAVSLEITAGDRFGASLPRSAASASWKSPVEMPRR